MSSDKNLLRQKMLNLRTSLGSEELSQKSLCIFRKLSSMDIYDKSKIIMCYMDIKNEVKTHDFINESLKIGKRIAIPSISQDINRQKFIIPCEIYNIDKEVEKRTFGILEPKDCYKRILNPKDIDMVIVPGVAFDLKKNRLGYGAGYYDRFLKNIKENCYKVGVGFEFQIVDEICTDDNDIKLDMIITEKRVIE